MQTARSKSSRFSAGSTNAVQRYEQEKGLWDAAHPEAKASERDCALAGLARRLGL